MGRIVRGAVAGAVGTVGLNLSTYADMLVRGRPGSDLPGRAMAELASKAGVDLEGDDDTTANRRTALGALAGLVVGVGVGAAVSSVMPRLGRRRLLVPAAAVGGLAMAGADLPLVAQGLTDPKTWGPSGWAADVIPHLVYGLGVVATLRVLRGEPWGVAGELLARVEGFERPVVIQ